MYSDEDYFKMQEAIHFLYQSFRQVADRRKPELLHSLHVGFRLLDYKYPLHIVIAGFLHDVLEEGQDGGTIKEKFGEKIFAIIEANTKNETIDGWPAQYEDLVPRIAAHGEDALTVKAADVLDNFIYRVGTNNELGKKKVTLLAKLLFKETKLETGIFKELRTAFDKALQEGKIS